MKLIAQTFQGIKATDVNGFMGTLSPGHIIQHKSDPPRLVTYVPSEDEPPLISTRGLHNGRLSQIECRRIHHYLIIGEIWNPPQEP